MTRKISKNALKMENALLSGLRRCERREDEAELCLAIDIETNSPYDYTQAFRWSKALDDAWMVASLEKTQQKISHSSRSHTHQFVTKGGAKR